MRTENERKVATLKSPKFFSFDGPSWSPDGKMIACARGEYAVSNRRISVIQIENGKITDLPDQSWSEIEQVAWVHSGNGLIVNARAASQNRCKQLWYVPYPEGQPQKITQDLSNYSGVSLSADAKILVSIQYDVILTLQEALSSDMSQEKEILPFTGGKFSDLSGISVLPNGNLVFAGSIGGHKEVWTVDSDGNDLKQITNDNFRHATPTVSRDGRSIAYVSERGGAPQIWVMDIDGKNQRQLTTGGPKAMPRWSPDGKWIVYASFDKSPTIWKIPAQGGTPSQLTSTVAVHPDVSPDGKFIACYYWDEQDQRSKLAVMPFDGGEPLKLFDVAPGQLEVVVRWSPDGNSLTYLTLTSENPKVYRQPLNGGPPVCLNKHKLGFVVDLAWSRDTRQLFYIHGIAPSDVIMIKDLPDSLSIQ
jgi:TolB protein